MCIVNESKIIYDFCTYNLIYYLQRRNPNVPGIINKLLPQLDRNIDNNIKKFYKDAITVDKGDMRDIYSDVPLKKIVNNNDLSIDHFIPWSYVANDEIWNLTPTSNSVNSSKSNSLPKWNKYFERFVNQKWNIYTIITANDKIKDQFNKIKNKYLNVSEIAEMYNQSKIDKNRFMSCYEKNIKTIYDAAERNGYKTHRTRSQMQHI